MQEGTPFCLAAASFFLIALRMASCMRECLRFFASTPPEALAFVAIDAATWLAARFCRVVI